MNDDMTLRERAIKVSVLHLENQHGAEILEANPEEDIPIVCVIDCELHFISVFVDQENDQLFEQVDEEERSTHLRIAMEKRALGYLTENPREQTRVSLDSIAIKVIGENRGFLRYHQNIIN